PAEAGRRGVKSGETGEEDHGRRAMWGHRWRGEQAMLWAGRLSEGAMRKVRAGAVLAREAFRKVRRAGRRRCRQPDRGRLEREARRAGSGGFGYGTVRRTSAAGV